MKKEELAEWNESIIIQVLKIDTRSLHDQMEVGMAQFRVKVSKNQFQDG